MASICSLLMIVCIVRHFPGLRFSASDLRSASIRGRLRRELRLVVIAHAPRDEGTRIISMRKGNRREQEIYQKRLGAD
jgi:uncharacterized DUF497 family protein